MKEKLADAFTRKAKDKEGYLYKRVGLLKGRWERRFVKMEKQEFSYYSEDKKGVLIRKGILDFDIYQVTIEVDAKMPGFFLRILNSDHEFFFRAPTEIEKEAEKR